MERVQELIDKLWKQNQRQEGPESLLATVQQLQDALAAMVRTEAPKGAGKVAVVLPPKRRIAMVEVSAPQRPAERPAPAIAEAQPAPPVQPVAPVPEPEPVASQPEIPAQHLPFAGVETKAAPEINTIQPAPAEPAFQAGALPEPTLSRQPYALHKPPVHELAHSPAPVASPVPVEPKMPEIPLVSEPVPVQEPPAVEEPKPVLPPVSEPREEREVYHLHFDMPEEAPTLTQQFSQQPKELHELIGQKGESLNDRLKQDRPELGNKLKETPIRDLRKAIGLNDKFLFIKELFRGDEAMYERSIKTINNFHILPEAEYWISRELKVKLGWDDSSDAAQSFYQLVKRRFA
ncbi:hypothetical protein SAMN05444008_106120 [Cnuella takakiae]|uniref:Uncharacterized protein n=1 Tax=Cnuella takakiae TaxID=1302690 RepID=A0A1M5A5U2_9BACT|nr:hypothetical protein [Cnuella takakiae]OLY92091.1 hypothetical protein BUE76_09425 [Cnuella takakiae]SHF25406.1 hypothetical protein SAMN05444008_106120 [Cnuella takakiae]